MIIHREDSSSVFALITPTGRSVVPGFYDTGCSLLDRSQTSLRFAVIMTDPVMAQSDDGDKRRDASKSKDLAFCNFS